MALYGSTTVSLTFGEGTTEYVFMILSGYSSRILEIRSVPIPDPVPPPKECVSWNPCKQSHDSDSFRTTSKTESTSSAPRITRNSSLLASHRNVHNKYYSIMFLRGSHKMKLNLPSV